MKSMNNVGPSGGTSLLGLLCFASFRLAILSTKDQSLEVPETDPPASACSIDPYPSSDDQALTPVASAHCMLATCASV